MTKKLLYVCLFILVGFKGISQSTNFWSVNNASRSDIIADKATSRLAYPQELKLFDLNFEGFSQQLFSVAGKSSKSSTLISLPNAAGDIETFEVFEASNFEPALQAQFPEIRSYSGKGVTDKYATLKLSISPQGVQTMVFRTEKDNEFIEPYSKDHKTYSVYTSNRQTGKVPWNCTTPDTKMVNSLNERISTSSINARSTGDLKTMRLAQSVTAEYSNYFGATSSSQVGLVLAAINNTLTRCNGVYEKDLALHLNLITNTTAVIYYDPATDPYDPASTGAGGTWNKQLQNTLTSVIGEANYDIGHLFGASGGGGNAGCIGCICTDGSKGSGFTSPADGIPQGDNFDIDYVVHEVGHQLGANHTFSMSNENTGVNVEVGSGITIMGYAGITSQDVAPHSIDIYHAASIQQIQTNLASKTCPVTYTITNTTPSVAAVSNYTIPISTPFTLTGSATDADGDALTYCWEQNDNASSRQTGTSSVASPTKATGPNWISFKPTTSPTRYFPQLSTILAGGTVTGPLPGGDAGANIEALSSVARTLNFRLTVRDNAAYSSTAPVNVAQTNVASAIVTVSAASGPFSVTAPNTAVTWTGGSSQTITWAVAGTTATPVSCANVKISLSTDGGQTFPMVLAANTPNDGAELLVIPNTPTTTARIKVEAVGNIFFDISNANFTITAGSGCTPPSGLTSSAITGTGATVSWTAVSGAAGYDVDYKLSSSSTWTNVATATTATSVSISGLTGSSVYDWRVRTNCSGSASAYNAAQFTTASTGIVCNAPTGLNSSAITSNSATLNFTAASGAVSYDIDYKLSSGSTWTSAVAGTTTTSASISGLTASSAYDWRVRTNCSGGSSSYSTAQFTTSAAPVTGCQSTLDNSTNNTTAGAATIPFNTPVNGLIDNVGDVDNYKFVITTSGSITLTLTNVPANFDLKLLNSAGTQVAISKKGGTSNESITYNAAPGTYYAQVYGANGASNATSCYTLNIQLGSASRIGTDPLISLYPNPVRNDFKVDMGGYLEPVSLIVSDIYGRRMVNTTFNGVSNISTSKFAAGVYMITIRNKNGVIIKQDKIVKQ